MFAQYAPYTLAEGDWDSRRAEIGRLILDAMAEFAPDLHDCVAEYEVLGPPDIERRIGLTGGHIFQGETMPDQMWEHRLTARTPVPGLYLCGAATHPAGSVIALNGRNAAMAVLADTTTAWSRPRPTIDRLRPARRSGRSASPSRRRRSGPRPGAARWRRTGRRSGR